MKSTHRPRQFRPLAWNHYIPSFSPSCNPAFFQCDFFFYTVQVYLPAATSVQGNQSGSTLQFLICISLKPPKNMGHLPSAVEQISAQPWGAFFLLQHSSF